jgi:hypothetical protein
MSWIAPPLRLSTSVMEYLAQQCNMTSTSFDNRRDAIHVTTTASCAARMLAVKLAKFEHLERVGTTCVRLHDSSPAPRVPPGADHVFGLGMFPGESVGYLIASELNNGSSAAPAQGQGPTRGYQCRLILLHFGRHHQPRVQHPKVHAEAPEDYHCDVLPLWLLPCVQTEGDWLPL